MIHCHRNEDRVQELDLRRGDVDGERPERAREAVPVQRPAPVAVGLRHSTNVGVLTVAFKRYCEQKYYMLFDFSMLSYSLGINFICTQNATIMFAHRNLYRTRSP